MTKELQPYQTNVKSPDVVQVTCSPLIHALSVCPSIPPPGSEPPILNVSLDAGIGKLTPEPEGTERAIKLERSTGLSQGGSAMSLKSPPISKGCGINKCRNSAQ